MGLAEYIREGARLERQVITLQGNISGSGSIDLGSAYILLSLNTTSPCRLRLYDNSASLVNTGERNRVFGNTSISASTALIGDFSMSRAGLFTVDPALYGVVQNTSNKLTYWRMDNTGSGIPPTIQVTRYLLEDPAFLISSRKTLPAITANLAPNQIVSGTISDTNIPTTYLLVSMSLGNSSHVARLRLYNNTSSFSNLSEVSRSFSTESIASSLIVDAIVSGSETTYFVPKIIGANIQNLGNDLNVIRSNFSLIPGYNELYYILQNVSSSGGTVGISASVHVFSLED
jgi:hypothetical protein